MSFFEIHRIAKKLKTESNTDKTVSQIAKIYRYVEKNSKRLPPPFDWQDEVSYNGRNIRGQNTYEIVYKIINKAIKVKMKLR